jgi:hypothetical protein
VEPPASGGYNLGVPVSRRQVVARCQGFVVGALLLAATGARGDSPVVHEYVRVRRPAAPATVGEPSEGRNPQAIRRGDRLLPAPADPPRPNPGEETLKPPRPGATALDRMTSFRPDRQTGPESTLTYREVFNPSVVPFKRGQALDLVRPDGTLAVADRTLRPVAVGGAPREGGELFFGSVMVEVGAGPAPLPSVAPEVRVLSYETEPRARLQLLRDGADNHWVQAGRRAVVRLKWLSEAPSTYFSGQVAENVFLHDVPPAWLRPLPPAYRQRAARVLAHLGVDRTAPLRVVLDRLVAWFRGFQPGELPPSRGDLYVDLALAQRGVCRHRAYAFVITALGAGIPARFVANEAHAFVEVRLPEVGWRRIDLGGAADLLQVNGAGDKVVHQPRSPDPFPQPRAYRTGATRVAGAATVRGCATTSSASYARRRATRRALPARPGRAGPRGPAAARRAAPGRPGTRPPGPILAGRPRRRPRRRARRRARRPGRRRRRSCGTGRPASAAIRCRSRGAWRRRGAGPRACGSRSSCARSPGAAAARSAPCGPTSRAASRVPSACRSTSSWATTAWCWSPAATGAAWVPRRSRGHPGRRGLRR